MSIASGAFYLLYVLLSNGYVQPYDARFDTVGECRAMAEYIGATGVNGVPALAVRCVYTVEI